MEKKIKTRKKSVLLILLVVFSIAVFAVIILNLQLKVNAKQESLTRQQAQYEEELSQKAQLEEIINSNNKDEYVERIAREELDYAKPGERVYYNVTPGEKE